ncbi:MAG: transcriptional regulator [Desulfuromonadales bacterium]|nr:transcriptional regulator [Desulfuromonadales bacterium]
MLIGFFLIYTVYQIIKQALLKPPAPPAEKTSRGEEMIQDPECGTYVPRNDAVTAQHKGTTHYFCSTDCRDKYQKRS